MTAVMRKTVVEESERSCPACLSRAPSRRGSKSAFEILSCQKCGSIYTATLPEVDSGKDYDGYYTEENLSVPDFINRRVDQIIAGFERYRSLNRLLELGFGNGSLLSAAVRRGWTVEGVEVSNTAAEHARAAGFKTFVGELSDARYEAGSFDVVIASELLEHVPKPTGMINEVARILRPGGLFWATTPNAKSLSSRVLGLEWSILSPPEHLHLFTTAGLSKSLVSAGFRRVRIETEGMNPFELVQKWRGDKKTGWTDSLCCPDRVNTGYRINEALDKSSSRRAMKEIANKFLRATRLGDSLKVAAER